MIFVDVISELNRLLSLEDNELYKEENRARFNQLYVELCAICKENPKFKL